MGEQPVSRLLGLVGDAPAQAAQPGVPPYRTAVFVPAHPRYPGGGAPPRVDYELLKNPSGPPVPVAFTRLSALVEALGPAQPWVAVSLGPFTEAMRQAGLPKVRLDPVVAPGGRRWRAEDLERAYGGEEGAR
ncbi:SAV_915 family protein [Streptomyces sp. SDr-06]|uniref:SAV_915 family protein n=1 Tax=Streptomyces sp. SDr-06 TaxID=2267702 RepID=UPI001CB9657D|nr:SAV_915 family protein [Streptomyces sp. SDr-06]